MNWIFKTTRHLFFTGKGGGGKTSLACAVAVALADRGRKVLLLDSTEAYHREVSRHAGDMPAEVCKLLPRLRDRRFTKVLLVCLPEATPVHEAAQLQSDLGRAGIKPFAWIINQSFAGARTSDPLLLARGANEARYIREVTCKQAKRTALVPWVAEEPVKAKGLKSLMAGQKQSNRQPQ